MTNEQMAARLEELADDSMRDARIAELEAALRRNKVGFENILDCRRFEFGDEFRYGALTKQELQDEIARIDAALKEARDDAR